jgi:hypothetical protein
LEELRRDYAACRSRRVQTELQMQPVAGTGFNVGFAQGHNVMLLKQIIPLCMEEKGYQLVPKYTVPPGEFWRQP